MRIKRIAHDKPRIIDPAIGIRKACGDTRLHPLAFGSA
jgi:hypothetical protein